MNEDLFLETKDLLLHTVLPEEYLLLADDYAHPELWSNRGFADPNKYFASNKNPIKHRLKLIDQHPTKAGYFLRVVVLKSTQVIVGSAGFHDLPDINGMIEIGFGVDPKYTNLGFGQQVLHSMWSWVIKQPNVKTLRYAVSPDNESSQHIIKKLGFKYVGQQIDEEDGTEDIFELSAVDYKLRFLGSSS